MKALPLLLSVLLVAGCQSPDEDERYVGSTAPDFQVATLAFPSTAASLLKRRGKVVLLDFWATWCGPCKAVTPDLEAVYAKYRDQGLEAMAITAEDRDVVTRFEARSPHAIPVYLDPKQDANRAFAVSALPTIIVVDRGGHILYRTTGAPENAAEIIGEAVERALGQR